MLIYVHKDDFDKLLEYLKSIRARQYKEIHKKHYSAAMANLRVIQWNSSTVPKLGDITVFVVIFETLRYRAQNYAGAPFYTVVKPILNFENLRYNYESNTLNRKLNIS